MLDTVQQIQTPEGVELNLSPAGPVIRGWAWAIDFGIRCCVDIAAALVLLLMLGKYGLGFLFIFLFLNEWFYPVYFEVRRGGQTPGKKSMGLRVIKDDGTPVDWGTSIIRNLIMSIDFFPFLYGLGLASMLFNKRFKRLGDVAAGTLVVHVEDMKVVKVGKVPEEKPERPPVMLKGDEQKAIVAYAERVPKQTMARNIELAEILKGLHGEEGQSAVTRLVAYANAIMGRK